LERSPVILDIETPDGANCCDQGSKSLLPTSVTFHDLLFEKVPRILNALAILELADRFGRLSGDIDLTKAKPPFPNPVRLRAPSKASLEKRKERVGDHRIFWSCGEHGDFGRYEIASAVGNFSATRLKDAAPLTH
jgi:hypothetical protein